MQETVMKLSLLCGGALVDLVWYSVKIVFTVCLARWAWDGAK